MFKQSGLVLLAGLAVLLPAGLQAAPNMKEGMWAITSKLDMPGMPVQMPAQTFNHCLTKNNIVPQQEKPGQGCEMLSQDVSGNTVTWKMRCQTPQGPSMLDGKVVYKGDSMEGVIDIQQAGTTMQQRMSGKRIGDCR